MKRRYLILFSLSGLVLCCDQLSKHLVRTLYSVGDKKALLPPLIDMFYARNNGFAFGLLQRAPSTLQEVFFVGVPAFAMILIILIFIKLQDNQMLTSIALTTILGGAVGNLLDRLHFGYVVDFISIHFGSYRLPPFNIADASIIAGVLLMFVSQLTQEKTSVTA